MELWGVREGQEMPLFGRKPAVDTAEFCRQWYEQFVFLLDADGIRVWEALIDQLITGVEEASELPLRFNSRRSAPLATSRIH